MKISEIFDTSLGIIYRRRRELDFTNCSENDSYKNSS